MHRAEGSALRVVCGVCNAVNRVPQERASEGPKCGKCSRSLLDGKPVELGESNIDGFVSGGDLPVLVDFWAEWCAPCRVVAPVVEQVAREMGTTLLVGKVDTDHHQRLAGRFAIRGIPTLILFKGGAEVDRVSGALDLGSLRRWISRHAGPG